MKETKQEKSGQDSVIQEQTTVGELVVKHPGLRQSLERLGIDYCCGGKRPLIEAAKQAGVQWPTVLAALNAALAAPAKTANTIDWNTASLTVLTDHILDKHHVFTKEQLPRLDDLLARLQRAHAAHHGAMLNHIRQSYEPLRAELDSHLQKEEQILFPAIKDIDAFMTGKGQRPVIHCGSIANPIAQMEAEHESAGQALVEIRRSTDNYQLPADACQTFAAFYEGMEALEADLHEHIHLENNILYPKSLKQEEEMGTRSR